MKNHRHYFILIMAGVLVLASWLPLHAAGKAEEIAALRGLSGVVLKVEAVLSELASDGLGTNELLGALKTALERGKVPVLPTGSLAAPELKLRVQALPGETVTGDSAYEASMTLELVRPGQGKPLWKMRGNYTIARKRVKAYAGAIQKRFALADAFCRDYHAANAGK